MIVLIMKNFPNSVKGEISQWLVEPNVGVFVGDVSARVRDELWKKIQYGMVSHSRATLIYSDSNEQGFSIRRCGYSRRNTVDYEGISLIRTELK